MWEHIVVALRHANLYADKVKDIKEPAKLITQYTTCNIVMLFFDDDLFLGSNPHNRPLFATSYTRGKNVKCILVDGSFSNRHYA